MGKHLKRPRITEEESESESYSGSEFDDRGIMVRMTCCLMLVSLVFMCSFRLLVAYVVVMGR